MNIDWRRATQHHGKVVMWLYRSSVYEARTKGCVICDSTEYCDCDRIGSFLSPAHSSCSLCDEDTESFVSVQKSGKINCMRQRTPSFEEDEIIKGSNDFNNNIRADPDKSPDLNIALCTTVDDVKPASDKDTGLEPDNDVSSEVESCCSLCRCDSSTQSSLNDACRVVFVVRGRKISLVTRVKETKKLSVRDVPWNFSDFDLCIRVANTLLPVHKDVVMYHSSFLRRIIGELDEREQIIGLDLAADCIKDMEVTLDFMYDMAPQIKDATVFNLLRMAKYLEMDDLFSQCKLHLITGACFDRTKSNKIRSFSHEKVAPFTNHCASTEDELDVEKCEQIRDSCCEKNNFFQRTFDTFVARLGTVKL